MESIHDHYAVHWDLEPTPIEALWHRLCEPIRVSRCFCAALVLAAALARVQAASVSLAEFPFEFREGLLWVEVNVSQSKKPLIRERADRIARDSHLSRRGWVAGQRPAFPFLDGHD